MCRPKRRRQTSDAVEAVSAAENKAEELTEVLERIPMQVLQLEKLETFPAKVVNLKALPKKIEIEGELKALNKLCKKMLERRLEAYPTLCDHPMRM